MTDIEFKGEQPKEKKSQFQNTAFGYFSKDKPSPYTKEGKGALDWLEVQELVRGIMVHHGIVPTSTADLQKKLPALIFTLVSEIDDLKTEKQGKKK